MSSQIPPLVCHTPPPIDFDDADDDGDDYGQEDIPEDDGIEVDDHSGADGLDDDFGDFATVPPRLTPDPIPSESVIKKETNEVISIPVLTESTDIFVPRVGADSPPSLILPANNCTEDDEVVSGTLDEDDYDFQPFGCPSQQSEPPPEDNVSLPSLHLDADTSKSEDDDHVPTHPNPSSATRSGIETEVDLPAVAIPTTADRTTPVIQEGGRFDDNTENDFTDFTTASNERSSVVLEIPTANDVSFELDDYAQLESTPSADSNFVSQQSRTDFATFDADFSKFDSFQASFPATVDDPVGVKTPLEETKSLPNIEQQMSAKNPPEQLPDDDFDDFQEFATFSEQPAASANLSSVQPTTSFKSELATNVHRTEEDRTEHPIDSSKSFDDNGSDDDDDDFGEFSDFKQPDITNPPIASLTSFSLENVHSLLETMFPSIASQPHASDTGQQSALEDIPCNSLHSQLQDFDNTSALAYQYSKSTSSKALITALGIDSRNIMYGPKWNSSMPRFAANLSFNPLEPLKPGTTASKDTGTTANGKNANVTKASKVVTLAASLDPLQPTGAPSTSVPAVQFDWNSSGLVNPLEASHAHTLLLDLEQLEVMASLNDKINVDSSSYPTALRSTSHVANTAQLRSPTTTVTTLTTPLLLSLPSLRTSPPSPPQPKQPPIRPSTSPLLLETTTTTSSSTTTITTTTTTTINTQTQRSKHDNNDEQRQSKTNENPLVTAETDGNLRAPLDCSSTFLSFVADHHDHDGDLLVSISTTTTPSPIVECTSMDNIITHTVAPLIAPPLRGARVSHDNTCLFLSGNDRADLQLIGFEMGMGDTGEMYPVVQPEPVATSASNRPQSFDDYLDLSVQEMLQKAATGQPTDGSKSKILDPEVTKDASPLAADDIAVTGAIPAPAAVSPPSRLEDDDDVRSLDFTANAAGSSNVQYSATLPHANQESQSQQLPPVGPLQPQSHYPTPPPQQPMSIASSPNNVPMVRTIKLQETHIFTPSRGGTPVSRDITDRDIIVREYHDVEYSLEKVSASVSRKELDLEEFNEFQSVPVFPPSSSTPGVVASYARPVIGQSPTEELVRSVITTEAERNEMAEADVRKEEGSEDDDFTEFQAASVPTPMPVAVTAAASGLVNKPVSSVQHNRSNTSSPVMLLSPAILLPQQASTPMEKDSNHPLNQPMSQINWPEPGIDPDELARFEAAFAKPASQKPSPEGAVPATPKVDSNQSSTNVAPVPAVEEDEWTDFISSKPVVANETSVPPPTALNLPKAASSAEPVVQEEWTDFISSTPTTGGSTSQNRLSSSLNNFNYSRPPAGAAGLKASNTWSQPQLPPPQFSSWNSNSLYYNPMSTLPTTGQQQQYPAAQHQQQQFYGRTENSTPAFGGSHGSSVAGASRVPTHLHNNHHHHHHHHHQHHQHLNHGYQHHQASSGARVLAQHPMHLLPELSFITPNAGGHSTNSPGAKPATHSFLSNVISSNSFAKK